MKFKIKGQSVKLVVNGKEEKTPCKKGKLSDQGIKVNELIGDLRVKKGLKRNG